MLVVLSYLQVICHMQEMCSLASRLFANHGHQAANQHCNCCSKQSTVVVVVRPTRPTTKMRPPQATDATVLVEFLHANKRPSSHP